MITVTPVPGRPREFVNQEAARAFIESLPEDFGYIMVGPGLDEPEQRCRVPTEG